VSDLPGYLAYRGLSVVLGALPAGGARALGRAAGRAGGRLGGRRRRLAARHMRRVLGADAPQAAVDALVTEMFTSYGRYWAEVFWYRPRRASRILRSIEVVNLDAVVAAHDAGRGLVLGVVHAGNWDVAGLVARDLGLRLLAVAEELPNRRIADWFVQTRQALGIEVLLTGGGAETTARLLRHLRSGGAVALLSDRDVVGNGVPVTFFGEETRLPAGAAALADRTGAALFPVAPFFAPGSGYRMVVRPELPLPDLPDRRARVQAGTQALAGEMETLIRSAPGQWHLFQPNWPSDPGWGESR